MTVILDVPCNDSTAKVTATFTVHSKSGDGGPLGRPPEVKNTTSATGPCGVARALTATVSDPDDDADSLRWRVDGVLMAPGMTSMIVTKAHTLEAIGRDTRGAAATARKQVSCS
ncbi:MAG TPA: hypothetical protein PKW35_22120 [Nannocystaceae bacterium]|nr:hypothetical protein [Nannocystaceae bacterium]